MRPLALALAGLGVFVAALVAFLPARALYAAALRPAGVEADHVTGPVWNARAYRVRFAGQPFAEADLALAFLPLLTGAARLEAELRDESALGRGTLVARPGALTLTDASLAAEIRRLPGLAELPAPQTERVYAEIERLTFRDGRCEGASGTISTQLLARLGGRYDVALPEITGAFGCAGEAVAVTFEGASAALDLTGSVRLDADGYRWTAEAGTEEPGVIAVLIALGFEETGAAWRAEGEGSYR
ncbi:hypothetical protein DDZ18_10440 [Marinicauda salina]|uniref:Type II secretion system protein N n=1 Tax=Marinicauda salina TaxID=2135793 RepID=A0A2U2BSY6_9PROT|nr:type II secretion system protein N [Marinicauda salina]PWE17108.1 hypothetical protein DDZ18_10440 [Marinicauda salina]